MQSNGGHPKDDQVLLLLEAHLPDSGKSRNIWRRSKTTEDRAEVPRTGFEPVLPA